MNIHDIKGLNDLRHIVYAQLAASLADQQTTPYEVLDEYINLFTEENMLRLSAKGAGIDFDKYSEEDINSLRQKVRTHARKTYPQQNKVVESNSSFLADQDSKFKEWYHDAQVDMDHYYWDAYKQHLQRNPNYRKKGIADIDRDTSSIMSKLGNPKNKTDVGWRRQGLVLGNIQSGKTGNYIGLMCRAADAGYKTIIVLTTNSNHLRTQTQIRIDEGFIGMNTSKQPLGVGKIVKGFKSPTSLTTQAEDLDINFSKINVNAPTGDSPPQVIVTKKNPSKLKILAKHLSQLNTYNESPTLIIDDEADNASVNIKYHKEDISKINESIRTLLKISKYTTYVGYTATPFANVFIDEDVDDELETDDLFPGSFIFSLSPPDEYFGPSDMFSDVAHRKCLFDYPDNVQNKPELHKHPDEPHNLEIIRDDHAIPRPLPSGFIPEVIPESLEEAVRYFILAKTVRLLRGNYQKHHSMLISVNGIETQKKVGQLVEDYLQDLQRSAKQGAQMGTNGLKNKDIKAFQETWEKEENFSQAFEEFKWEEIQEELWDSIAPVQTKIINSDRTITDSLDYGTYEDGASFIAVGGFVFGRGFTLNNLLVSYILRHAGAKDTLLQVGRWYGYYTDVEEDYHDLVKVWMGQDTADAMHSSAQTIRELAEDFSELQQAGGTPRDFALKVRHHPGIIRVTAKDKMGAGKLVTLRIQYNGKIKQTYAISTDINPLQKNLELATKFFLNLKEKIPNYMVTGGKESEEFHGKKIHGKNISAGYLFKDVSYKMVLEFMSKFKHTDKGLSVMDWENINEYITQRTEYDVQDKRELLKWDIHFPGIQNDSNGQYSFDSSTPLNLSRRSQFEYKKKDRQLIFRNGNIRDHRNDEAGMEESQYNQIEQNYFKEHPGAKDVPDNVFYKNRKNPLLSLYLVKIKEQPKSGETIRNPGWDYDKPVALFSVIFPETEIKEGAGALEYVVKTANLVEDTNDDDKYYDESEG